MPDCGVKGRIVGGLRGIRRLVQVDQSPIGRTPRSDLATYTGLFDQVRALFAATPAARAHRYDAGRFSFNVAKGHCAHCAGEGFVMVELLFLPSVYTPCLDCAGDAALDKRFGVALQGNKSDGFVKFCNVALQRVSACQRRPAGAHAQSPYEVLAGPIGS